MCMLDIPLGTPGWIWLLYQAHICHLSHARQGIDGRRHGKEKKKKTKEALLDRIGLARSSRTEDQRRLTDSLTHFQAVWIGSSLMTTWTSSTSQGTCFRSERLFVTHQIMSNPSQFGMDRHYPTEPHHIILDVSMCTHTVVLPHSPSQFWGMEPL